jgi:23S rRNA pseudouridine2605 synthase
MMMRLQKFLAHAGICSRRKAEAYIQEKRVQVNGEIIDSPGLKIDPEKDSVVFDSQTVTLKENKKHIYIALNKPVGYVTSCSQKNTKIVLDLIDIRERIYPVGRLDKDSKGLILLTDDGQLHNKVSHPSFNHEKVYLVKTTHPLSKNGLNQLRNGVVVDGRMTRKCRVQQLSRNRFKITLKEGRNRQIRKMVGKIGNQVDTLQRIKMANINLGKLKEGQWRYLTQKEIETLTQ